MPKEALFFTLPAEEHISPNTPCLLNNAGKVTVPRPVRVRSDILEGGAVNMHDLETGVMLTFQEAEAAYYEEIGIPTLETRVINHLGLVALPKGLLRTWNMQRGQTITFVDLLGPIAYFADASSALQAKTFLSEQAKSVKQPMVYN